MRAFGVLSLLLLSVEVAQAQQIQAVVRTSIFGGCTCRPQADRSPPGPDPTTVGMLSSVLSNQGQILYQLGRMQGQQSIIMAPQSAPISTPVVPTVPYNPAPLPIAYNPTPLPPAYNPTPLPPAYNPTPLPPAYNPTPLPPAYNPQIIVAPGGGGVVPPAGGYSPDPLPSDLAPRGVPRGYGGGAAPGIDFRYYGPTNGYPVSYGGGRNGSSLPPAPQPQAITRSPRSPR